MGGGFTACDGSEQRETGLGSEVDALVQARDAADDTELFALAPGLRGPLVVARGGATIARTKNRDGELASCWRPFRHEASSPSRFLAVCGRGGQSLEQ